jgi:CDP-paratose 2-epimerase
MNIRHKRILITGGAGFVGSTLALKLKAAEPDRQIIVLDNLHRKGSELNLPRLEASDIEFRQGDVREQKDLSELGQIDLILECSAEPSVLAGYGPAVDYVVDTNLIGTINCLRLAREHKSDFLFLSTSRIYPFDTLNQLAFDETDSRFELASNPEHGVTANGISENFPLKGIRSLYGSTKLASELMIEEFADIYGFNFIINRCGVIAGPWQMGKVDQGVVGLWVAAHYYKKSLQYIGYEGSGKQVRDILHVDDLYRLIELQMESMPSLNGSTFNVGGGNKVSTSLKELTELCRKYTNNEIAIEPIMENRRGDVRAYITDNSLVTQMTGWEPELDMQNIVKTTANWIDEHSDSLRGVL